MIQIYVQIVQYTVLKKIFMHYKTMLDFLSDILTNISMRGTLYFRTSFTSPWGVAVPSYENVARFHFAHRGGCLVSVSGSDQPISLEQGDLIIIPHGSSHELFCSPDAKDTILQLDTVLEKSGYNGSGVLVYGGEESNSETQLICGHFSFDKRAKHVLMDRLPPYIHLKNYGETAGKWLEATLRVIADEAAGQRLGGDLIALKMSEAIFAQAIRSFVESDEAFEQGLSGFSDMNLRRAIGAFHKTPAKVWTVELLAQVAGMSRTSFAVLFQKKMKMTPMQYVTEWRMEIAKKHLCNSTSTLSETAEKAGYSSDSAFARTFKKETGYTPAGFKKIATSQS
jgi:AraC-like DNA-binding protein